MLLCVWVETLDEQVLTLRKPSNEPFSMYSITIMTGFPEKKVLFIHINIAFKCCVTFPTKYPVCPLVFSALCFIGL